ncbi:MAG: hypothetical protein BWY26_00987 [Elusimicrobia bacterium ADurb.Bin231]|nr:MAG: hypothetical protein BWY26_00987 [Elusimicrobia bacterium ADurb.Bin231]
MPQKIKLSLFIFVIALLVRGAYLLCSFGIDNVPDADSHHYNTYADNLLTRHEFTDGFLKSRRAPGYPLFLAAVYGIFGKSVAAVKIIQLFASAFICVIIYNITSTVTSGKFAFIAGLFACFYHGLFEMPAHILSETFFTLFFTISVYFFISAENSIKKEILGAIFLAAATYFRPITLIFPLFLFVWLYIKADWVTAIKKTGITAAVFAFVLLPWTARNYAVHGAFVPINVQSGYDFWASNNENSLGQWNPHNLDFNKYGHLNEYQRDRAYFREGWTAIKTNGVACFIKTLTLKFAYFMYPFLPEYDLTFVFLAPFFFFGIFMGLKNRNEKILLIFLVIMLFCAITVIFYGSPRFRGPMSPFMVIAGCLGAESLAKKFGNRIICISGAWLAVNIAIYMYSEPIRMILKGMRGI